MKGLLDADASKECPLSAEQMAKYFHDKISRIHSALPSDAVQPVLNLPTPEMELTVLAPVTSIEVEKCIRSSASKSCNLDPMPTWLLKQHLPSVLPHLTFAINKSLSHGVVPGVFKQALITPVLKKPSLDPGDPVSYRPVSNLTFFSKILEKLVAMQLTRHHDENDLHHPFQSAYRAKHSVETALIHVHNDIAMSLDKRKGVVLVMLDLSAAFDTVDHSILLSRMRTSSGVNGLALQWMKSYLDGRQQSVRVKKEVSGAVALSCGVPQGSVLGPLLFSIYIRPLWAIAQKWNVHTHQYADDCQLYLELQSNDSEECVVTSNRLKNCVQEIGQWMTANRLKLNREKTELIVFVPPRVPRPIDNLYIDGVDIAASDVVRNLGFHFEMHLNPTAHIDAISRSCFYHLGNIGAIRRSLTREAAEILVHAFISSRLDFCNALLAELPGVQLKKLQRIQNTAARIVTGVAKHEHITPSFRELRWLPVRERITYKLAVLAWKALHGEGPAYLQEILQFYVPSRHLRSASAMQCQVPMVNTLIGRRSFSYAASKTWNALPYLVRSSETESILKTKLKTHLFTAVFN